MHHFCILSHCLAFISCHFERVGISSYIQTNVYRLIARGLSTMLANQLFSGLYAFIDWRKPR